MPRPTRRPRLTERVRPAHRLAQREDGEEGARDGGFTNPAVVIGLFGLVMSAVFTIHMMATAKPAPPDAAAGPTPGAITETLGVTDTLGLTDTFGAGATGAITGTQALTDTSELLPVTPMTDTSRVAPAAPITDTAPVAPAKGATATSGIVPGGVLTGTGAVTDTSPPARP